MGEPRKFVLADDKWKKFLEDVKRHFEIIDERLKILEERHNIDTIIIS